MCKWEFLAKGAEYCREESRVSVPLEASASRPA